MPLPVFSDTYYWEVRLPLREADSYGVFTAGQAAQGGGQRDANLFFPLFSVIVVIVGKEMELQYTYWKDGAFFVGFLDDYPDDSTQGVSLAELKEALIEVYQIKQEEKEHLAKIRKTGKIKIPA